VLVTGQGVLVAALILAVMTAVVLAARDRSDRAEETIAADQRPPLSLVEEIDAEDAANRHLIPPHLIPPHQLPYWDEWYAGARDEARRVP